MNEKIRIAYDAWQLTMAPQIDLVPGRYMEAPGESDEEYIAAVNILPTSTPKEKLPPCEVCALGALLVAKTLEYGGDLDLEDSDLSRSDITENLPFEDNDLDFIESCFERTEGYLDGDDERRELLADIDELYESGWEPDDMARALFLNLIENEGKLRLNRKKPGLGLDRRDTLSDQAREVLVKFNIPCLHPQLPLPIEEAK